MSNDELNALVTKLRALHEEFDEATARAALAKKAAGLTPAQRAQVEALIFSGASGQTDAPGEATTAGDDPVQGVVAVGGTLYGAAVGVNQGTVQLFFGAKPPADARQLLTAYLDALGERYRPLALGRLLTRERGGDERATVPTLPLRAVYTALSTDARLPRERFTLSPQELEQALAAADPDQLPPDRLRFPVADRPELPAARPGTAARSLREFYHSLRGAAAQRGDGHDPAAPIAGQWYEPELAVEALAPPRSRIVLLGEPGAGKSTVLRYLVVSLAEALLAGATAAPAELRGWAGRPIPVPIFCPLGPVARALDDTPATDLDRLVAAALQSLFGPAGLREGLRESILPAWSSGGVLLCFDGLDEVSGTPEATADGPLSRRERLAAALTRLGQEVGASRVVITCRTRPYEQDRAWQLPAPWQTRRLEPFALGQVRSFIEAWYAQSGAAPGARLTPEEGRRRADELRRAIAARPGLREVCASPLLLTMVLLLHYNQKQLPDERAEVYEELVGLLLDRWEWVRAGEPGRGPLVAFGERLGLPQLRARDLRAALNQIADEAHRTAQDGRGVIAEQQLYDLLEPRFRAVLNPDRPERVSRAAWTAKVESFLELLTRESGLLQPEGDRTYGLPHLTFEEYLAACYLAEQEDVEAAYARWQTGGDRWREPLLLLMGCLRLDKKHRLAEDWLGVLLDETVGIEEKSLVQRQRDVVLAAACYQELGGRRYGQERWHARKVAALEGRLRAALLGLLAAPAPAILLPQRLEAGEALGRLGDPRIPVSAEDWRGELARRGMRFGEPAGYWCYVPQGTYRIGGWEPGEAAAEVALAPLWIARFPLTVAQYAPFVAVGYTAEAERWWTPEGWPWKGERSAPWGWGRPRNSGANQPVIGVTWYEATAFCAWLTEQLQGLLPDGYVVRLPTEAEWEAAATFAAPGQRRPYPWGAEEPSPERAIYDAGQLTRLAPVGCCPAGAAACGALDMAGNVWEWTTSHALWYPERSAEIRVDFTQSKGFAPDEMVVPLRGGAWRNNHTTIGCAARNHNLPYDFGFNDIIGLRVCLAARTP